MKPIDLMRWAVDSQGHSVGSITLGPQVGVSQLDLTPGPIQETSNPLDLALAYARDAAGRPDPRDRRKALELLAEAVAAGDEPALARAAADTAWSEPPPTPAGTVELADEVDRRRRAPA